jgi:hypothetical protein
LPFVGELESLIERRWQARSVENKNGSTALTTYVFHFGDGSPIGTPERAGERPAQKPDCRISWYMTCGAQIVGTMISGHKTASVYKRYRIVPENDIRDALQEVEEAINQQKKPRSVTTMTGSGAQ